MAKIQCPVCDEPLGNSLDDIPEKCPICDTRKHEILMELRPKEEPKFAIPALTAPKEEEHIANNEDFKPSIIEENVHANTVLNKISTTPSFLDGVHEEIILTEVPPASEKKPWDIEEASTPDMEIQHISENVTEPSFAQSEVTESDSFENITKEDVDAEFDKETPQYIPPSADDGSMLTTPLPDTTPTIIPTKPKTVEPVLSAPISKPLPLVAPTLKPSEKITQKLVESRNDMEDEESQESSTHPIMPPKYLKNAAPSKSGASNLEVLPGFQYCAKCQKSFRCDEPKKCTCGEELHLYEKGFPPGDYLILYNAERKAIAYFLLDTKGSIFIGRSSERASDRDIDLSLAWKNFYYRNFTSEEQFRERMRLLKGISRKHALIRFDKERNGYILFHLSDKNYTVAELPSKEKRTRSPQNRNRIDIESDTIISMGNQKDFIIMRYKKIAPPAQ